MGAISFVKLTGFGLDNSAAFAENVRRPPRVSVAASLYRASIMDETPSQNTIY
jgi:hypothetical protein